MYGNFLEETDDNGLALEFRSGADRARFRGYRGSAIWCGRGFVGRDGNEVATFDGLPKLFGVSFQGSHVSFHQRFVRNTTFEQAMRTGFVPPGITVTPHAIGQSRWNPLHATRMLPGIRRQPSTGTGALEVQHIGGRALVGYEGMSYAVEVDPHTLATLAEHRFGRAKRPWNVPLGAACFGLAHADGSRYNYVLEHNLLRLGTRPVLRVFRVDENLTPRYFQPVELDRCVSIHNLVVTNNYVIAIVCPEQIRLDRLLLRGNVLDAIESLPRLSNEFLVYHRHSGKLLTRVMSREQFTFNHVIRADEHGTQVTIDLVRSPSVTQRLSIPMSEGEPFAMIGKAVRYQLDLATENVASQLLWDEWVEMPYVDGAREKPGYANYFTAPDQGQRWGLCHIYERRVWLPDLGGLAFSSPIVCDDLVMVLVCDPDFGGARLVLLEGSTFEVVAEAPIPADVGLVAHGGWVEREGHQAPALNAERPRRRRTDHFARAVQS